MFRLTLILYILTAVVSAGAIVTALLSMRIDEAQELALGALAGALVAVPVAWLIGRHIWRGVGKQA